MKSSLVTCLILSIICSKKRALFSSDPPHLSSLRLVSVPRNWQTRYPCAPCISTPSNPAFSQRAAAVAKASTNSSISESSSALVSPLSESLVELILADTGCTPVSLWGQRIPPWKICAKEIAPCSLIPVAKRVKPGN